MFTLFKAGAHEATNRCNTLLQQIALCVQSSDKSCAVIAAIGCSDKSPGVNTSTFGDKLIRILSPRQNFVAACCNDLSPRIPAFKDLGERCVTNGEVCYVIYIIWYF